VRVLVDAVWTRENREDAVQINDWPEEDADLRVVDQEHQCVRDPIVAITIKRGVDDTFDQLFEATDLGSNPWSFTTHQDQQVDRVMAELELLLVAYDTKDGLREQ